MIEDDVKQVIAEEQYENFAGAGKDDGTLAVIRSAIAFAKNRTQERSE